MNLLHGKNIDEITKKSSCAISAFRRWKDFADRETLVSVYNALAQPHFDYCFEVWDSLGDGLARKLQRLQNRCARVIMNCRKETGQSEIAMQALGWISLAKRRAKNKAEVMFKILHGLTRASLSNIFAEAHPINGNDNLRNSTKEVALPLPKRDFYKNSPSYNRAKIWNDLPEEIRSCETFASFTAKMKSHRP